MLARVNEAIAELKANPPPVPVGDIAEAIQFLEWLIADNFTLLGVQDYIVAAENDLHPVADTGLGLLRRATCRSCGAAAGRHRDAGDPAFFNEPKPLIVTKANVKSRVHRRVIWTTSASSASTPRARRRRGPLRRPVHVRRLYARRRAPFPTSGARPTPSAPCRLRSRRPFRQGAVQRARDLSARRAVPDRRGHALRLRAGDHAARGTAARPRARAPRPLRPLRLGDGLRAARPLRHATCARRSATTWPTSSTAASAPSIRRFRTARWCASISSSAAPAARRRTRTRRRWRMRSRRSSAPGRTTLPPRSAAFEPIRRRLHSGLGATRSRAGIARHSPPDGGRRHSRHRGTDRGAAHRASFLQSRRAATPRRVSQALHLGGPIALSERVPVLENMGFRVIDEQTYRVDRPAGSRRSSSTI